MNRTPKNIVAETGCLMVETGMEMYSLIRKKLKNMTDGNYPQGARYEDNAPWNNPKVELPKVYRTISISFEVGVEVPENYTDADLQDAAELWSKRLRVDLPITNVEEII